MRISPAKELLFRTIPQAVSTIYVYTSQRLRFRHKRARGQRVLDEKSKELRELSTNKSTSTSRREAEGKEKEEGSETRLGVADDIYKRSQTDFLRLPFLCMYTRRDGTVKKTRVVLAPRRGWTRAGRSIGNHVRIGRARDRDA